MTERPLGSPAAWSRDFAILGLISSLAIPLVAVFYVARGEYLAMAMGEMGSYFVAASILGLISGLAFGPGLRALLLRFPSAPFGALLVVIPALAAVWGAAVAWFAVPLSLAGGSLGNTTYALAFGAIGGGLQIAWFWPLYLGCRVRQRPVAPLFALAAVTSVGIGPLSVWALT